MYVWICKCIYDRAYDAVTAKTRPTIRQGYLYYLCGDKNIWLSKLDLDGFLEDLQSGIAKSARKYVTHIINGVQAFCSIDNNSDIYTLDGDGKNIRRLRTDGSQVSQAMLKIDHMSKWCFTSHNNILMCSMPSHEASEKHMSITLYSRFLKEKDIIELTSPDLFLCLAKWWSKSEEVIHGYWWFLMMNLDFTAF